MLLKLEKLIPLSHFIQIQFNTFKCPCFNSSGWVLLSNHFSANIIEMHLRKKKKSTLSNRSLHILSSILAQQQNEGHLLCE